MTAYTYFGHPVDDELLARLPDRLVVKEDKPGGVLVRIERNLRPPVPLPRKAVEL